MNAAREAAEEGAHGVDHAPEGEDDEPTHGHDAVQLRAGVVLLDHGQEQDAQDRDAVDGEVGAGQEEADHG